MKNNILFASLLAAFVWGVWPIVARLSKASPDYINITVSFFTFFGIVAYYLFKDISMSGVGTTLTSGTQKEIWFPIFAGLLNSIGIIIFGYILSVQSSPGIEVTKYAPIATGAIPMFTLLGGFIFLRDEEITWEKIVGVLAITLGVYFLNKK